MTRQHFTAGLLFGGAAAAITYADGATPVTTVVIGALVAIATWAVAYATNQH